MYYFYIYLNRKQREQKRQKRAEDQIKSNQINDEFDI